MSSVSINNYVKIISSSKLKPLDLYDYFQSESLSGGGELIKENTVIVNDNEVIICFKYRKDSENVLKTDVHSLVLPSGLVLLLEANRSFNHSLVSSQKSQGVAASGDSRNTSTNDYKGTTCYRNPKKQNIHQGSKDVKAKKFDNFKKNPKSGNQNTYPPPGQSYNNNTPMGHDSRQLFHQKHDVHLQESGFQHSYPPQNMNPCKNYESGQSDKRKYIKNYKENSGQQKSRSYNKFSKKSYSKPSSRSSQVSDSENLFDQNTFRDDSSEHSSKSASQASYSSVQSWLYGGTSDSSVNDDDSSIEVTGLNPQTDDEIVRLFFENSRRSGGGDIKFFTRKGETALITFYKRSVAASVLSNEMLELDGSKLSVKKKTCEVVKNLAPWDRWKFVIRNVPDGISYKSLCNFVEDISKENFFKVLKGTIPGVRIICFKKCIGFYEVYERCRLHPHKQTMEVHRMQLSHQVEVNNFPENITKDVLLLHFESSKYGGGEIINVEIDQEYNSAVISFKDHKSVPQVIKMQHIIKGNELQVFPYYSCIGYQGVSAKTEYLCKFNVEALIFNFIQNTSSCLKFLKGLVEETDSELDLLSNSNTIIFKKQCSNKIVASQWEENVNRQITDFLRDFKSSSKINIDKSIFTATKSIYENIIPSENSIIKINEKKRTIDIVGQKDAVDKIESQATELSKIHEVKTISLSPLETKYFLLLNIISDFNIPDLKIYINKKCNNIVLEGCKIFIMLALEKLEKNRSEMISSELYLSEESCRLIKNKECSYFLGNQFKKASIFACFYVISKNGVAVASNSEKFLRKAIEVIKSSIKQINIFLKKDFCQGNSKESLEKLVKEILENHQGCVSITILNNRLLIVSTSVLFEQLVEQVQQFLENNHPSDLVFDFNTYKSAGYFFVRHYQEEITDMCKKLNVCINLHSLKLFLSGPVQQLSLAMAQIKDYMEKIITDNYNINKLDIICWFKNDFIKDCVETVMNKNICWIEEDKSATVKYKIEPESRVSAKLQFKHGDITKESVDIIVNGYYGSLKRGTISNAIIQAAGLQIDGDKFTTEELLEYSNEKAPLPPTLIVTAGGNLLCSKIIHINLNFDHTFEENILKSLKLANSLQYRSIAFPAFGTGIYGFSISKLVQIFFNAVDQFNNGQGHNYLTDVIIVLYDENVFQKFTEEVNKRILSQQQVNDSGVYCINGINVELKTGDIFKENADILVNSIGNNLDLLSAEGAISQGIIKYGGPSVIRECQNKGGTNSDGLAYTTAGDLKFDYIIHFASNNSHKLWIPRITNCLKMADSLSATSIAFPCLGTGAGQLSYLSCAKIMLEGIQQFVSARFLKTIKIVELQENKLSDVVSVFEDCQKSKFTSESLITQEKCEHTLGPIGNPEVNFIIHVKKQSELENVKKDIMCWIESKMMQQVISEKSDIISSQISKIHTIAKEEEVVITVNSLNNEIIVKGLVANVLKAVEKLYQLFTSVKEAYLMSKTVQWYFRKSKCLNFNPVNEILNIKLEKAYLCEQKQTFNIHGLVCDISSENLKRRDLITDKLPIEWDNMSSNEKVVVLDNNSEEYQTVFQHFVNSFQYKASIISISRIQNKSLYEQYCAQKERLNKKNSDSNNESVLYHGTSKSCIQNINSTGFNRSLAGQNGTAYGIGSYFARDASYSHSYARNDYGERNMYQCKVLTGQTTAGNSSMKTVPNPYDCLVDNIINPSIFVVFHDSAAYPAYLITYN